MIHDCHQVPVTVALLGIGLDSAEVRNSLDLANQRQRPFHFKLRDEIIPLADIHKLANGSYALDEAVKSLLHNNKQYRNLQRPLILVSSFPFGDREHGDQPGWFYFSEICEYDPGVSIISTQPLEVLSPARTLQQYLLLMLATNILSSYANLAIHDEVRGCPLDYCEDLKDADRCFRDGRLCNECEGQLQKRIRSGQVSLEKVAAAMRLLNRAIGRKCCFIAMPFGQEMQQIHKLICQALKGLAWEVKRGDEITFPRLITNSIVKEIITSDLVVADLTGYNPNVFLEVGITQAIGNDLLLLTQENEIPIDIKNEQTIFYTADGRGLRRLKQELQRLAGSGAA